ncbi:MULTISPECIES: hypothetical protein [unclassified Acinetobacter]|uniref:hypothetical protein n=1 Tax=unclassified Acinetobacter TaxID=196816 RepID=UPI0015D21E5B|nr:MULTISPECIES: hypothetical protein [unclassified Acinetobacter]
MTYRSNPFDKQDYSKFAFKKSELLAVLQAIDGNFSFDTVASNEPIQEAIEIEKPDNQIPLHIKILAMNDYFTIVESACFISLDEPEKIQAYVDSGDLTYDAWRYGEHIQAVKIIENAIRANKLDIESDGMIPRASLQKFLFERTCVIPSFNDNLSQQNQSTFGTPTFQQTEPNIENQSAEIARLRGELAAAQERIKQMELIQTSIADESKLGSTRAENNVAKLILALSELASIDISKPYAPYESLKTQSELLGVDKFPSNENVATWLKRANAQKS